MSDRYDVVIVGGGVIGSAIAYFLTADPDFDGSVAIVERDTSYARSATALSAASVRTQFSNPINVAISKFGSAFIRDFASHTGVDLGFREGGYLFLAATEAQESTLRANHAVQRACGADVVLWDADQLAHAFPHLWTADIRLASYGRSGEGWFDNTGLMSGFRQKAKAAGAEIIRDEVTGLDRAGARITDVRLASGRRIAAGRVVNAAGPRAGRVAAMAGVPLPVEPRKRTVFVFDAQASPEGSARVNQGRLPLMIDPTGVYCRPEGRYFLCGATPDPDPPVDPDDFEPRHAEFEEVIWPALAHRAPAYEAIRVIATWAGHYDFNALDHNLIVGSHPGVTNLLFANGFSGHGLQQAPAAGRAIAELIVHGAYRTLDLTEVGYERVLTGTPFLERAVI